MQLVLFIVFVVVCALLLCWATGNSRKKAGLAHEKKLREREARSRQLETPAVYTLADPNQPWHTRRHPAKLGVVRTNAFAPKSESAGPEYDGYSRRDRHHLTDPDAHVKEEAHLEDPLVGKSKTWGGGPGLAH